MKITVAAVAAMLGLALAQPVAAQPRADFDANPYDDGAPAGLRFAALEFAMPTDPLLWSSDPGWRPHHTPQRLLADAIAQLRTAVPAGTPAADAGLALTKAGARCRAARDQVLECRYRDVETPWEGSAFDAVTWTVRLTLAQGLVTDMSVSRDWTRR